MIVILNLSFIVAIMVALPATFLIATRSLFAWSFDRVIPDKVSEVNERTRSPLVANVVVLVVTLIYLAVIVFAGGGFLTLLYTSGIAEILTFSWSPSPGSCSRIAARQLYEASRDRQVVHGTPRADAQGGRVAGGLHTFFVSLCTADALGANSSAGIRATVIIAIVERAGVSAIEVVQPPAWGRPRVGLQGAAARMSRFLRKREKTERTRVFFATDVHGSERCFRKCLNAAASYDADVLILGGDVTGKLIVPIVATGESAWHAEIFDERVEADSPDALGDLRKQIRMMGRYDVIVSPEERAPARRGAGRGRWRRSPGSHTRACGAGPSWPRSACRGPECRSFMMLGNDDDPGLADVVRESSLRHTTPRTGSASSRAAGRCCHSVPRRRRRGTRRASWKTAIAEELAALAGEARRSRARRSSTSTARRSTRTLTRPRSSTRSSDRSSTRAESESDRSGQSRCATRSNATSPRSGCTATSMSPRAPPSSAARCASTPGSEYADGILRGAIVDLEVGRGVRSWQMVQG